MTDHKQAVEQSLANIEYRVTSIANETFHYTLLFTINVLLALVLWRVW
jgi:hypothetical protein